MKKFKYIIIFLSLFPLICYVYIHINNSKLKKKGIYRGHFFFTKSKEPKKKEIYKYLGFSVENKGDQIVVQLVSKFQRCFTIKGTFLRNSGTEKTSKVNIFHELNGNYILDFYCFFPKWANKNSVAALEVNGGLNLSENSYYLSRSIETNLYLQRYQIPIKIKKGDVLTISLLGKGMIILGEPVFYQKDDFQEKELVFIISADTLRRDHVGVYNPKKFTTPGIDQFARDAVVFTNAYSSSSWTLPAHVSLFTGKYAHRHDLNFIDQRKNQELKNTLFSELQKKYMTCSYNGGVFLSHLFGFSDGFDGYFEAKHDCKNSKSAKLLFQQATKQIHYDGYKAPLLFFLHTYQIHSQFHPEKEIIERELRNISYKFESYDILELTKNGKNQYNRDISTGERQEIIKTYDAGICTFDFRFNQLIQYLKAKNLYKSSMIILFSDHGEAFMDHGGWEHGHSLYNELIKIPMIVKFPGNQWAGLRNNNLVSLIDILPTLFDARGIKKKKKHFKEIDGISLRDVITRKREHGFVLSYLAPYACSKTPGKAAIIYDKYKLIYNDPFLERDINYYLTPPPLPAKFEFFNLSKDEYELQNIKDIRPAEYKIMLQHLKKIKFNENKTIFPKELHQELKQLGYIN